MRTIGTFAVGLALVSGTSLAQAQTAVSRQITSEPVETVVTQGPNGTAVTRRILTPEPGVNAYLPPDYPAAVPVVEPQYVAPVAPAVVPRRTITEERVRTTHTAHRDRHPGRAGATRPHRHPHRDPHRGGAGLRPAAGAEPGGASGDLSHRGAARSMPRDGAARGLSGPDRRRAPGGGADRGLCAAARRLSGGRLLPRPRLRPAIDRPGYRPAPYYRDPYHPEYGTAAVALSVGARIPPNVQLVAVPDPVVARVPAARPYSYARYGERVYLVDPATGVIVADITQ